MSGACALDWLPTIRHFCLYLASRILCTSRNSPLKLPMSYCLDHPKVSFIHTIMLCLCCI